jgi:hypothetical protein
VPASPQVGSPPYEAHVWMRLPKKADPGCQPEHMWRFKSQVAQVPRRAESRTHVIPRGSRSTSFRSRQCAFTRLKAVLHVPADCS